MTRRPRVTLLNQYFHPDVAATAQLLSDLAEGLTRAGFAVQVIASTGSYVRLDPRPLSRHEDWHGVRIVRVRSTDFGRRRALGRVLDYAGYFLGAAWRVLRCRRGEIVVALSTPPFIALLGLLAKCRGARFVYKVEDLYPDLALALGALRPGFLAGLLERLSRRMLAHADGVVALDDAMARAIHERRGSADGVHVIPNWADGAAIVPKSAVESEFRTRRAIDSACMVVGYSGNFGRAHRFDALLDAAERLAHAGAPVHFLFTGDGPRIEEVRTRTARLPNLTLCDYQPREALADTLAASDIHVVSLRAETEGLLFPSKLAGILAAGRPVLALSDSAGLLAQEVRSADIGWTSDHDADHIVAAIEQALADPALRRARGRKAREYFELHYDRPRCTRRWCRLLAGLCREPGPRAPDGPAQSP